MSDDHAKQRIIMSEQDLATVTPAEVSCPKCGAGVPAAEELIDELVADVIHLIGECDIERVAGMNDWRTRALEYEAVIWKAYWECDSHFDTWLLENHTWLLENLPDTHARIQNAVKRDQQDEQASELSGISGELDGEQPSCVACGRGQAGDKHTCQPDECPKAFYCLPESCGDCPRDEQLPCRGCPDPGMPCLGCQALGEKAEPFTADMAFDVGYEKGERAATERIVKWLRTYPYDDLDNGGRGYGITSDAIELVWDAIEGSKHMKEQA